MKLIAAVVVLYRMSPEDSPSCSAMEQALRTDAALAALIDLLVIDNSPRRQPMAQDSVSRYVHDGTNPGLAARYNFALQEAKRSGVPWLLLLDQDTKVTPEYLRELSSLAVQLREEEDVVAVAPKLYMHDCLQSPHLTLSDRYRHPSRAADLERVGIAPRRLRVFNSGAMVRIAAMEAIGGFPEEYWLDYLDHATFERLQARGGKIYVMNARLQHEMSIYAPHQEEARHAARQENRLTAERRFYDQHGSREERMWYRLDLTRQALGAVIRGRWKEATRNLRAALAMGRHV